MRIRFLSLNKRANERSCEFANQHSHAGSSSRSLHPRKVLGPDVWATMHVDTVTHCIERVTDERRQKDNDEHCLTCADNLTNTVRMKTMMLWLTDVVRSRSRRARAKQGGVRFHSPPL